MISTRGRYAIRVMLDLAQHETGGYIPLKEVAERQEISKKYLEIIVRTLVSAGMIEGASGKGGGYRLLRKPEEYSVGEILELTEGSLSPVACLSCGRRGCSRKNECRTLPMWEEFNGMVHDFFYSKKLTDLLREDG